MKKKSEKDVLGCDEQPLWKRIFITICIWAYKIVQILLVLFMLFVAMIIVELISKKAANWYEWIFLLATPIYLIQVTFSTKCNNDRVRKKIDNNSIIDKILKYWEYMPDYLYNFIYSLLLSGAILISIHEALYLRENIFRILWLTPPALYLTVILKYTIKKSWIDILLILFLIAYFYFNGECLSEALKIHSVP